MLWGRVTGDVEDSIKEDLEDPDIQVLQCGPAAEKGVRYGALISSCNRANGRTGLGTVMAAKKLKAIAVRGHKSPELARPDLLKGLAKWGAEHFPQSDIADMRDLGTNVDNLSQNEAGGLPTRNWSRGAFDGIASLTGERIAETVRVGGGTCYACVVGCKQQMEVVEKPFTVDPRYGGAEYETVAMMGSLCGVSDMTAIARANQICNMYGMDTISCGATVAWAMDCYEQGLITKQTTGGIELRFGNAEALVKMVELIASREGFGHVLGEGSARASQVLGVGEELVVAVKGQELPGHMPQVKRSLALIYAVNPFGADHQSHEHDDSYCEDYLDRMATLGLLEPQSPEVLSAEKVRYTLYTQFLYGALDCLSVCQFVFGPSFQLYSPSQLVEAVRSATGWDVTLWELMKLGERRLNMQRAFNVREGVASEADELPAKLFTPLKGGASEGRALSKQEFYQARDLYYQMAGWDAQGIPLVSKLQELGVGWIGARMTEG